MTTSGDTQVRTRIPVPSAPAGPLPTVALTLAVTEADATREFTPVRAQQAPAEATQETQETPAPVTESHDDLHDDLHEAIYEEAMATIAALASNWSSAVPRPSGRHRSAA